MEGCFKKFASSFVYPSSIHCPVPINCPAPISFPCTLYTVLYLLILSYSPSTLLYSLTLSCMALHCPASPYIVLHPLHCPASPHTVLYSLTLPCTPLHCPVLPYTVLYSLTLSCIPYTVLYSFILSWIPLHCPVPHYTPALPCSLYSAIIPISMSHTLLCPPFFHSTSFNPSCPLFYYFMPHSPLYSNTYIHAYIASWDPHMRMNCAFCLSAFEPTLLISRFQRALISWDFHTLIFS